MKQYNNYADLITYTRASSGTALRPISYGDELVSNGTFDSDVSGWTASSPATLAAVSGELEVTGASTASQGCYQSVSTTIGKVYEFKIDARLGTAASPIQIRVDSGPSPSVSVIPQILVTSTDMQTFTAIFVAQNSNHNVYLRVAQVGTAYFDNISVREVLFDQPDGTLTLFNHPTNIPRIEYDSDGNRLGLLVEEQRTNLVTYSENFSDAGWTISNSTKTVGVADPFGGTTAMTLTATSANGQVLRSIGGSLGTGTSYTGSFYIRRRTGTGVVSLFNPNGGGITAIAATSEWTRHSVIGLGAAATNYIGVRLVTSGDEVDIAYAQFEAGSFPTSYIPTSGSTATRSADVASIGVSAFGYNQAEGTLVVEVSSYEGNPKLVHLNDGSDSNRAQITAAESNVAGYVQATGDSGSFVSISGAPSIPFKAGLGLETNNIGLAVNSSAVSVDTSQNMPVSVSKLNIGSSSNNAVVGQAYIKSIKYYPRRLTNAQLQELTS